jgi:drug/metabolite transporter (DMT)-like permease
MRALLILISVIFLALSHLFFIELTKQGWSYSALALIRFSLASIICLFFFPLKPSRHDFIAATLFAASLVLFYFGFFQNSGMTMSLFCTFALILCFQGGINYQTLMAVFQSVLGIFIMNHMSFYVGGYSIYLWGVLASVCMFGFYIYVEKRKINGFYFLLSLTFYALIFTLTVEEWKTGAEFNLRSLSLFLFTIILGTAFPFVLFFKWVKDVSAKTFAVFYLMIPGIELLWFIVFVGGEFVREDLIGLLATFAGPVLFIFGMPENKIRLMLSAKLD